MTTNASEELLADFGLDSVDALQEQSEKVLAYAISHGASDASLSLNIESGYDLSVRECSLDELVHRHDQSITLDIYRDHACAQVTTSDWTWSSLRTACDRALLIASKLDQDPCSGLADSADLAFDYPDLSLYHPWQLEASAAIEQALALESAARQMDSRIILTDGCDVSNVNAFLWLSNTRGFTGYYPSSYQSLSLSLIAADQHGKQSGFDYTASVNSSDLWSIDKLACSVVDKTVSQLDSRRLSTRSTPVIFSASVAIGLVRHLLGAISGANIYQKQSFLQDKLGESVFSSKLTLTQDPHLLSTFGSVPFDAEGVKTHPRTLIDSGVLCSFIMGNYSARRLGLQTTGNASCPQNVLLQPGKKSLPELLQLMDRGLLVTGLMGQGVSIQNGNYSRGAYGFWVENGVIQFPVHEITIASNLKDMFNRIVDIGSDVDRRGRVMAPSLLIDSMSVAGSDS